MKKKRSELQKKEADEFWLRYNSIVEKDTEIISKTGIKQSTLSTWVAKHRFPGADDAVKIANALERTVEWFVTGKDKTGLTNDELTLLDGFRQLDSRDQGDVLGIVDMKIENAKKGDTLSNLENA